jgi:hypothetical protein
MKTTTVEVFTEDLGLKDCFEVSATVDVEHCDDSDYNREHGYGHAEYIGDAEIFFLVVREVDRETGDVIDHDVLQPAIVKQAEEWAIEKAKEKIRNGDLP